MIFSTIALFITLVVGEISDRDKLMKCYASDRFLTIIAMEAMVLAFIESIYSVFAHSFGPVMITLCFGGVLVFLCNCLFRKVYRDSHNSRNELHIGFMIVFVTYTGIFNLKRQEEPVFSQLEKNLKNIALGILTGSSVGYSPVGSRWSNLFHYESLKCNTCCRKTWFRIAWRYLLKLKVAQKHAEYTLAKIVH